MRIIKQGLGWQEAKAVLAAGGAVTRPHWTVEGRPMALAARGKTLVLVDDDAKFIHLFVDPESTLDAQPWMSVALGESPLDVSEEGVADPPLADHPV